MSEPAEADRAGGEAPARALVLYVNPHSPTSHRARQVVEAYLKANPSVSCTLDVRDVQSFPAEAEEDRILYTPTLVIKGPGPVAWMVGTIGSPESLAAVLGTGAPEERT